MPRDKIKVKYFTKSLNRINGHRRPFIGISLKNETMKSNNFVEQIFQWTAENVGDFDLLIGDHLERYNYQAFDNATEIEACEMAMRDGAEARERLSPFISPQSPFANATVISAADLCECQSFDQRLTHFRRIFSENAMFRSLIEGSVDNHLMRMHPSAISIDGVRNSCVAYQLEELAMFEQLSKDGYDTFLYPGPHLPIMKSLVSGQFPGISDDIECLTLIELRIIRREPL